MKIAYVVPHLSTPSGWRTASLGIINALRAYAHIKPVIIVSTPDKIAAQKLFPEETIIDLPNTQSKGINQKGWRDVFSTWWRVKQLKLPPVDLVHSLEAYPTGLVGHWIAKSLSIPHVLTGYGTYAVRWHKHKVDKLVYSHILRQASRIHPMSKGTAQAMKQYFSHSLSEDRLQVILLGTDYTQRIPKTIATSYSLSDAPIIISVGAVKPRKGYHISLAAFAQVQRQIPTAKYYIIGDYVEDTYFRQLQDIIQEYDLKSVYFLGRVTQEDLEHYYETADLFLLTSQQSGLKFEGFGLVYIEAGAYGLPVVGTHVGGVADAIKDGETGFLAMPTDVDEIAQKLITLLQNPEQHKKMGQAGREWAETLTWQRYAETQSQIYQDII